MTLLKKIQMDKKSHLKIPIELYALQTLPSFTRYKITVLLSHLRKNYAFIVGTAGSSTHSSYLQYKLKLLSDAVRFKPRRNLPEWSPLANTQKIVKKQ